MVIAGSSLVTCNYICRKFGVEKYKPITECLRKCPNMKIVNGEDITKYKEFSNKTTKLLLHTFGREVIERLGLDEHFIDVTKIVEQRIKSQEDQDNLNFEGALYPNEDGFKSCECGCEMRLKIGSLIAKDIRRKILENIGLTCSAGISHNKFLAKLVSGRNKPDGQTCLAPKFAKEFMRDLQNLKKITGIGEKVASKLESLGIFSIEQLQKYDIDLLKKNFGNEMATKLKNLADGIDESVVKPFEKPNSISFENSFRPISTKSLSIRSDVAEKFQTLLKRLLAQIQEDNRMPNTVKITLRKYDSLKKSSVKETRQCAFPRNCFKTCKDGKIFVMNGAEEKIMKSILTLYDRMVDMRQMFSITLIGLCFSKFSNQINSSTMAKYLIRKQNIEAQSITNISNDITNSDIINFRTNTASPTPSSLMDFETISNNSYTSISDDDNLVDPSPKKRKKLKLFLSRHNSNKREEKFELDTCEDISPTKLNVSNLRLTVGNSSNIDHSVWQEIPPSIKRELITNWQSKKTPTTKLSSSFSYDTNEDKSSKLSKINTLDKYFLKNS